MLFIIQRDAVCVVVGQEGFDPHVGGAGGSGADMGVTFLRGDAQSQAWHVRGEVRLFHLTHPAAVLQFASSQPRALAV